MGNFQNVTTEKGTLHSNF